MANRPHIDPYIDEPDRPSADDMDEKRKADLAYEYLCRLDEVRNWFSECLNDEKIPSAVELEENLRNGVLLARMSNYFAPSIVRVKKIFDLDESRYGQEKHLEYRHTDNLMHWRRAMEHVGLPEIFFPETTDVYDKKNMPKTIFCVHALAVHLHRRRLAPPIRDVSGNAAFTKEEIAMVAEALAEQGHRLPPFKEIGGILSEHLSADEVEVHAAVVAINEAVDSGDPSAVLEALENRKAGIDFVSKPQAESYLHALAEAKDAKTSGVKSPDDSVDMYDVLLSRNEIQQVVNRVNVDDALHRLDSAVQEGALGECLLNIHELQLPRVLQHAAPLYLLMLQAKRQAKGSALTAEEVAEIVEAANAAAAVKVAVVSGDSDALVEALLDPALGLKDVDRANANVYLEHLTVLYDAKRSDKVTTLLNAEEIQLAIHSANTPQTEEQQLAAALDKLRHAAKSNDLHTIAEILSDEKNGFKHVDNASLPVYAVRLRKAVEASEEMEGAPVLTFEEMQDIVILSNVDIRDAVAAAQAAAEVNVALIEKDSMRVFETLVAHSDSLSADVRPEVGDRYATELSKMQTAKRDAAAVEHTDDEQGEWLVHEMSSGPLYLHVASGQVCFEKHSHMVPVVWYLSQPEIKKQVETTNQKFDQHYKEKEAQVTKAQAQVRAYIARKHYQQDQKRRQSQDEAARKIQNYYRQHQSKKDYQTFKQAEKPSLRVVKTFASLLVRTELDYEEEMTTERLKAQIAKQIRSNRKLEEDVAVMDMKIGLLVKNRLGIEEVLQHGEKLDERNRRNSSNGDPVAPVRQKSFINKGYRDKVNAYQHLLYHLQTEPEYLTRLIFGMNSGKLNRVIDSIVLPLFCYATQRREEYLLLNLLKMALEEEINQKITRLDQFGSPDVPMVVPRIIINLARHVHGEALLRELLKPSIEELLADSEKSEHLNTEPLEIYKYVVGVPDKNMTAQQAADHPEVAKVLLKAINYLIEWADKFRIVIANGKDKIPYGIRYMSKVLKNALHAKFPDEPEKEILKAVGHLVYDEYISPAISSPESVQIFDKERAISQLDRKKLGSVAKLLQYGAANKGYGDDKSYLTPLNPHIKRFNGEFRTYLSEISSVPDPEEEFGIDRYSDYTVVNKPTVFLALGDLLFFHAVLLEFRQVVAPDKLDPFHALLDEAGAKVPRIQDIAGQQDSTEIEQMQLTLALSPKRAVVVDDGHGEDRQLFLATKKFVLDLLLSQAGDSLTAMLDTRATEEEERAHKELAQRSGGNAPEEFKSLEAKKQQMKANLDALEKKGLVSRSDDYQAIVSAIALDIRKERKYRDGRRTELERLRETANRLDIKRQFYNDQVAKYHEYLETCLENLSRNSTRASIRLDSAKAKKVMKKRQSMDAVKSVKYSADKMGSKGILLSIDGFDSYKMYSKYAFEFKSSESPGLFEIQMKPPNEPVQKAEVRFQELLQAQYEGDSEIVVLGKVHLSVDELIFTLNKKFYAQS